ncbi:MAG: hypothetical protein WCY89_08975 [Flavobacteriaceae bacterium]
MKVLKKILLTFFLLFSITGTSQTRKHFNTFTIITYNGKYVNKTVKDNAVFKEEKNYITLISDNFTFENAYKTNIVEHHYDEQYGRVTATLYTTRFYEILLIQHIDLPKKEGIYLKIIDAEEEEYLIHLHNKL